MTDSNQAETKAFSYAALESLLEQRYDTTVAENERSFYDLWHANGLHRHHPVEAAVIGGMLADRPAWIFAAGYQATLKSAFPALPEQGWAAFAATEDVNDPDAHPGTTLEETRDGYMLNGYKSWVGHSRLVDHMVITVNDPGGDKYQARGMVLPAARAGVTLSHRDRPKFLAAMSQGFAKFNDTPIALNEIFPFEPIRQFGRSEAKFVMLASTAFLAAHARDYPELRDRFVQCAAAIVGLIAEKQTSRQVYGSIDRRYQAAVDDFEQTVDTSAIADYSADSSLFRMYSARIQRRVGYAQANAGQAET